jgi:hypothetical protein
MTAGCGIAKVGATSPRSNKYRSKKSVNSYRDDDDSSSSGDSHSVRGIFLSTSLIFQPCLTIAGHGVKIGSTTPRPHKFRSKKSVKAFPADDDSSSSVDSQSLHSMLRSAPPVSSRV